MPINNKVEIITVDVTIQNRGIPAFDIFGMPVKECQKMKQRIKNAIVNSGYSFPRAKISVFFSNYSSHFLEHYYDLPLALILLCFSKNIDFIDSFGFFGELKTDGTLIESKFSSIYYTQMPLLNYQNILINANEISTKFNNLHNKAYKITNLNAAFNFFTDKTSLPLIKCSPYKLNLQNPNTNIIGNLTPKRCLEIAVFGKHPLLFIGPPGVGKTSLINFVSYLHPQTQENSFSIYLNSLLTSRQIPINHVPLLAPTTAISHNKMFTDTLSDSHYSNANNGYLFVDEINQFSKNHIEGFKLLLDDFDKNNSNLLSATSMQSSKNITFLAACNPCSCGLHGSHTSNCKCTQANVLRYKLKIPAGLIDRFHLFSYLDIKDSDLFNIQNYDENWYITSRNRIQKALNFTKDQKNIDIQLRPDVQNLVSKSTQNYKFSVRTSQNMIKVARTIATLSLSPYILPEHFLEALSYRNTLYYNN